MDRDSFDAIVIVKVGPSKTPFNMHKGLLCNAAPYFKAAFDGNFTEAKCAVLELLEEDVVMFKRFQLWVYTDKLLEEGEGERSIEWGTLAGMCDPGVIYLHVHNRDVLPPYPPNPVSQPHLWLARRY